MSLEHLYRHEHGNVTPCRNMSRTPGLRQRVTVAAPVPSEHQSLHQHNILVASLSSMTLAKRLDSRRVQAGRGKG